MKLTFLLIMALLFQFELCQDFLKAYEVNLSVIRASFFLVLASFSLICVKKMIFLMCMKWTFLL